MKARKPLQFSIAMLLALTGLVAVISWALVSEPTMMTGAIVALLVPAFPSLAITGCVNTRGYGRAFWIGAASVSIVVVYNQGFYLIALADDLVDSFRKANEFHPKLAFWWGAMIPVGLLCVAFRWMLLRGSERDGPET